jgi:predicted AlkP superfamily phosphohydrolase/phosphomutase
MKRKIILFGIDGAPWSLIDRFVAEGVMPNFKKVLEKGVKGTLMSTIPYLTLPAWTSIFTGVNPGKHGMIDFRMRLDGKFVTVHSRNKEIMSVWQILSKHGLKSVVVNDPVSYFPEKINGVFVTGLLTLSKTNYVEPATLAQEVEDVSGTGGYVYELPMDFYRIVVESKEEAYKIIEDMANKHARVALHLAKKFEWDILAPIFTSTDRLQHFYWNEPEYIRRHYMLIDKILGDFMAIADQQQADIFIVSDHGFGPYRKAFYINTWLEGLGLLVTKKTVFSLLAAVGLNRQRIVRMLNKLHLYNFAYNLATKKFKGLEESAMFFDKQIDFARSKAFSESKFGIYVNEHLKGEEYDNVRDMIIRKLEEVRDNGVKVVEKAFKREEILNGKYMPSAHDIFVVTAEGYEFLHHSSKVPFDIPRDIKGGAMRDGCHRPEGIFAAYGPDIRSGVNLGNKLHTIDITPTLLYILGLQTPNYADGRVIREIFRDGVEPVVSSEKVSERARIVADLKRIKS